MIHFSEWQNERKWTLGNNSSMDQTSNLFGNSPLLYIKRTKFTSIFRSMKMSSSNNHSKLTIWKLR